MKNQKGASYTKVTSQLYWKQKQDIMNPTVVNKTEFILNNHISPTVCAVLAIDSWKYYSEEKCPTAQHICKIYNLFYTAE